MATDPPSAVHTETRSQHELKSFTEAMENFLKPISIAGIALYGLGLLVANSYLARNGVTAFTLIKPQCIFTGMWSTIFLAFAAIPSVVYCGTSMKSRSDRPLKRVFKIIFAIAAAILISTAVATLLRISMGMSSDASGDSGLLSKWLPLGGVTPPGWIALLFIMNFFVIAFILPSSLQTMSDRETFAVLWLSLAFFAIIGAVLVVGNEMYPAVSRELGGGRSVRAEFLLSKDGEAVVSAIRAKANGTQDAFPPRTVYAELIFNDSDFFVLRINSCSANRVEVRTIAVVDAKLVNAYLPLDESTFFSSSVNQPTCK